MIRTRIALIATSVLFVVLMACAPAASPPAATTIPAIEPTVAATTAAATTAATTSTGTQWMSSPFVYASCCNFPAKLDPAAASDQPETQVVRMAYEPLLEYKFGTYELVPQLATSWSISPDGKEYTFELREGVKFHDGTDFTADAVKYSYDRAKALKLGVAAFLSSVDHVEVVDENTVKIVLVAPDANFQWAVPTVRIVNPVATQANEVNGDMGAEWLKTNFNGTGPYQVTRLDPPNAIYFTAFDDYWGGWDGPHFQEAIWRFGMDYSTKVLQLEQGNLDLVEDIAFTDAERLGADPNLDVIVAPQARCACWFMNTASGPLAKPEVRKAMQASFPYETVSTDVFPGLAAPMAGAVPPGLSDLEPADTPWKQDLDLAKELLTQAGYTDQGPTIRLGYVEGLELESLPAQVWQSDLAKIGVNLELFPVPWGTLVEAMGSPDTAYDIGVILVGNPTPYGGEYLKRWAHSELAAYKWTFYKNPELDALIEKAALSTNAAERQELLSQAETILLDNATTVFGFYTNRIMAKQKDLQGYVFPLWSYLLVTDVYNYWRQE